MADRSVSGVVLAAGTSARFGNAPPKQLVKIDGEPLVLRTVRRALQSSLSEVIVVVGHSASRVREVIMAESVSIVENHRYLQGQSTSVRAGLGAVDPEASAAMFLPIDQPQLTTTTIDTILDHYRKSIGQIVIPTFRGRRGAPVIIDRALFGDLAKLVGDEGARQLFARHADSIIEVSIESEAELVDIDRISDLDRLLD